MRLSELYAEFIRREVRIESRRFVKHDVFKARPNGPYTEDDVEERVGPCEYHHVVATLEEADGVQFLCPKCFAANNGPVGTHSVICWRPRVPPDVLPNPGRWEFQGTGLGDLTLVAGSSSILLTAGCKAHFFVRNGGIE